MSYTRTWSDAIPSGGTQASTIDESIRAVRVDVHERALDVFDNWDTGPVKLKDSVITDDILKNTIADRSFIIGPHSGSFITGSKTAQAEESISIAGAAIYVIPLVLPTTASISNIEYIVSRGGGLDITCRLKRVGYSVSPAAVQLQSSTTGGSGVQVLNSGTIAIIISSGSHYYFYFSGDGTNAFTFYGIKVVYHVAPYYG